MPEPGIKVPVGSENEKPGVVWDFPEGAWFRASGWTRYPGNTWMGVVSRQVREVQNQHATPSHSSIPGCLNRQ
jgi:hypothetical protein